MCLQPSLVKRVKTGKRKTLIATKVASIFKMKVTALKTKTLQAWMTPTTTCGLTKEVSSKVKLTKKTSGGMRAKEAAQRLRISSSKMS